METLLLRYNVYQILYVEIMTKLILDTPKLTKIILSPEFSIFLDPTMWDYPVPTHDDIVAFAMEFNLDGTEAGIILGLFNCWFMNPCLVQFFSTKRYNTIAFERTPLFNPLAYNFSTIKGKDELKIHIRMTQGSYDIRSKEYIQISEAIRSRLNYHGSNFLPN